MVQASERRRFAVDIAVMGTALRSSLNDFRVSRVYL